jgi:hypothetical protein
MLLKARASAQPRSAPTIDWSSPLSVGLVGLVWAGEGRPRDIVNRIDATATGATLGAYPAGVAQTVATAGSNGVYYARMANPNWMQAFSGMTFGYFGNFTTPSASKIKAGVTDGTSGFMLFSLFNTRDRQARIYIAGVAKNVQVGTWADKDCFRAMTWDGSTVIGYDDGKAFGSAAATGGAISYSGSYTRVSLFGNPDSTSVAGHGYWMGVWNRPLTPSEIASLNADPWQIFDKPARRIWAAASASGASSATPAAGLATVSASGASSAATTATAAAGVASVSGVGSSTAGADASAVPAAGLASVSGVGASMASATATPADGVATVSGVGSSVAGGSASAIPADGVATVSAAGASVSAASAVPAAGVATVSAVGSDGSAASGGGGYDKPKKRKFIQKVGDRIVVFESATAAINAIKAEPVVISAQKTPPKDAVKVEAVEIPALKVAAKAYGHEQKLMAMLKAQQYQQMLELHKQLQDQQDEEDIELLALWA